MKRKCPKCGSIEESKFCTNCGQDLSEAKIVKVCPNCGAETTSKFCVECGTRIDEVVDEAKKEDDVKIKAEEEALAKKKAEEEALAKKKAEEEALAKKKAEEEALAKKKAEEEALAKKKADEERKEKVRNRKKYEEAMSYMEHADQTDDKSVAAQFYRKAEALFEQLSGWEDSEEQSLISARKAKSCEIAVESMTLKQHKNDNQNKPENKQSASESNIQKTESKKETNVETKATPGKSKSKALIAAVIIGVLVIGGAVFALSQGKSGSQNGSVDNTSESSSGGDAYVGDLIPVEDGVEIKWDTGSAVLKNYQLEKSEYEGDCVNLYFDYSKTGGEDDSFNGALDVGVFQNGYELDEKSNLTTDEENNSYSEVKNGANITAARGFLLNDTSDLTVVLTAHDKDYNNIIERTQLTIPADKVKDFVGNKKYFEDTGEKSIKDGITIKTKKEELALAGYKWTEYEGNEFLVLYFDYTNLQDAENSMSSSDFNVTVFQNGVEQENSGWSTSEAESHFFSQVQKGTTMHCAYSYSVKDKSDIEVKLSCYTDDGEKTEEQVVTVK